MHFINTDGRFQPELLRALVHPRGIVPMVLIDASDDRPVVGAQFRGKGIRIGLERKNDILLANDLEFVDGAFAQLG